MSTADGVQAPDVLDEIDELAEALRQAPTPKGPPSEPDPAEVPIHAMEDGASDQYAKRFVQWSTHGNMNVPAMKVRAELCPGMYEINATPEIGIHFDQIDVSTENLVRFRDSNIDEILSEITDFWGREDRFRRYHFPHKRGILMWGPQGTGKTCATMLVMEDVIKRGGVVLRFGNPGLFITGLRLFRSIQPKTPVVVIMEDLDELVSQHSESQITNILDGGEKMEKVIFLATTNYPHELGARIVNRPSRFDRIFRIGNLSPENRRIYIEHLLNIGKLTANEVSLDIDRWVDDTNELSISHIKELFVSVVIFEAAYELVIKRLRKMCDTLEDQETRAGFRLSPEKMG